MCSQNKEINNGVRVPLTERGNLKGQKPNTPNPFIKVTDQGGSTNTGSNNNSGSKNQGNTDTKD